MGFFFCAYLVCLLGARSACVFCDSWGRGKAFRVGCREAPGRLHAGFRWFPFSSGLVWAFPATIAGRGAPAFRVRTRVVRVSAFTQATCRPSVGFRRVFGRVGVPYGVYVPVVSGFRRVRWGVMGSLIGRPFPLGPCTGPVVSDESHVGGNPGPPCHAFVTFGDLEILDTPGQGPG